MKYLSEEALKLHKKHRGKWELKSKVEINTLDDLALYYSPGVAEPCKEIDKDVKTVYDYTNKGNTVAIVSDSSAVLGLGDIKAEAGLPVMEGKAILLKKFSNVDSFPLCIDTKNKDDVIKFCKLIAPSVGGILLEDIAAPQCVDIEKTLQKELNIPVFHDDQHGTSIVSSAAIIASCKLLKKNITDLAVTVIGTGAAGSNTIKMLQNLGITKIKAFDIHGALHNDNPNFSKYSFLSRELIDYIDPSYQYDKGTLEEVMKGSDVLVGVSKGDIVTPEMIKLMNKDPIVLALANPSPEIMPDLAKQAGAKIIGTGRSDFPNQINNVLCFPGLFKGLLETRSRGINKDIIFAAVHAIANFIPEHELREDYIIPSTMNMKVTEAVTKAVKEAVIKTGLNTE